MSFYSVQQLVPGKTYKLTEFIQQKEISYGYFALIGIEGGPHYKLALLCFCNAITYNSNSKAEVFLKEAHAQFGDPTWRRVFIHNKWTRYQPLGSQTWVWSWVEIKDAPDNWRWEHPHSPR